MSLSEMMAEDAGDRKIVAPTAEALNDISWMANRQVQLEERLDQNVVSFIDQEDASVPELEELLRLAKERLAKIRDFDLPNAMEAVGLTEFKLKDETKVTIKEDVYAGITEENRDGAFGWLEKTGNDGIIKNEIKCPFGKGQDTEATQLSDLLTSQGFSFTKLRTVHPQTLKAFVKGQLEQGKPMPLDLFSVHIKKTSHIKRPKTK